MLNKTAFNGFHIMCALGPIMPFWPLNFLRLFTHSWSLNKQDEYTTKYIEKYLSKNIDTLLFLYIQKQFEKYFYIQTLPKKKRFSTHLFHCTNLRIYKFKMSFGMYFSNFESNSQLQDWKLGKNLGPRKFIWHNHLFRIFLRVELTKDIRF